MKHVLSNNTILRSPRQVNLYEMIHQSPGLTFKEIWESMADQPVNDAGVRMCLDRLEDLQLVVRDPPKKRGRGRFAEKKIRWFPRNGHGSEERV